MIADKVQTDCVIYRRAEGAEQWEQANPARRARRRAQHNSAKLSTARCDADASFSDTSPVALKMRRTSHGSASISERRTCVGSRRSVATSSAACSVAASSPKRQRAQCASSNARATACSSRSRRWRCATRLSQRQELYDFLHGAGDAERRFERWVEVIASLPRKQTRVLTWPLVTVFGFIAQPGEHIFLKPNVSRTAARKYGFDLQYKSRPSWETYASFLEFAATIRRDLKDLRPRDMIDLQSFMWVQGSDEYPEE